MEQHPENLTACFLNNSYGIEFGDAIGGVAVVMCVILMVLILCLKAYKTFIDRLVLYITVSGFLYSVSLLLQMVGLMENKVKGSIFNGVCSAVGYLTYLTLWMVLLFLMVISLHLFLLVAFQVKVSKYEKLVVVGIPIISVVIATIPFMTKSYGSSISGCWINIRENNNQSIADFTEIIVLAIGPSIVVASFGLFAAVYVTWVICRQRGARRQHMEAVKETIHLVLYPVFLELADFVLLVSAIEYYINDMHCQRILMHMWLTFRLADVGVTLALLFHVILTEHRRRKRKRQMQRTESETRYTVPPEFSSEVGPLVITGARPQEPETAYNALFITASMNRS